MAVADLAGAPGAPHDTKLSQFHAGFFLENLAKSQVGAPPTSPRVSACPGSARVLEQKESAENRMEDETNSSDRHIAAFYSKDTGSKHNIYRL